MTHNNRTRSYSWEDPMLVVQSAASRSGLDMMQAMIGGAYAKPPIAETLDFDLTEVSEGRAVFEAVPAEFHYNPIGVVHGGFASTLLDSAMGCAVQTVLPAGVMYTTLELHVNFVRPITKDTGLLRCTGEVIHAGRRTATAQARLEDVDGKLYSHGTTTCIIFSPDGS